MNRNKRVKEIMTSIGQILHNDWDPIGVRGVPEAQNEYESYIGEVYRLIVSGASEEAICSHLSQIEVQAMGLGPSHSRDIQSVARKLLSLNVKI